MFLVSLIFLGASTAFKSPSPNAPAASKQFKSIQGAAIADVLDSKVDYGVGLGTVLDIFSTDIRAKPQTAYTSDVFVRLHSAAPETLPSGNFKVPETSAWRFAIGSFASPAPVAAPIIVESPPDVLAFLQGNQKLSDHHERQVKELFDKTSSLSYLSPADSSTVFRAMRVAYCAFWGKKTARSMEVLINRARGTAAVLGELKADVDVLVAGILHEVLSELPLPNMLPQIHSLLVEIFGFDAIALVESYSRLPKFGAKTTNYTPLHSENQMQMLVALAEDYRSLYIRLADRLHSMRVLRSLAHLDATDRTMIAQEVLNVYAPLAHKMGVMSVKGELEDLAFRLLKPALYLESKRTQWLAHKALHDGAEQIQDMIAADPYLASQSVSYRLPYRVKDKYQLALKMARKGLRSVNEVRDAVGMRVIIDTPRRSDETVEEWVARGQNICYHIVGKIRELNGWEPVEGGFKDYVANAKANGYQSLHQYIRNQALNTFLEVQVRTREMHLLAELGDAAHWNYKDNIYRPEIASSKMYKTAWRSFEQTNAKSPAELIGLAKKQLNANRVFVFLEDESTVINLKRGATTLDTAFAIHTSVGLSAKQICVNGQPAGMKRVVQNGDVIRVECVKDAVTASASWLQMARLPYTQAVIRKHLRHRHRSTLAILGCVQLLSTLALNKNLVLRFFEAIPSAAHMQRLLFSNTGFDNFGDFLSDLGSSATSQTEVAVKVGTALGVPFEDLSTLPFSKSLFWIRTQISGGFQDVTLKSALFSPLLKVVLPACGMTDSLERWRELVGIDADCEPSPAVHTPAPVAMPSASPSPRETKAKSISIPFKL